MGKRELSECDIARQISAQLQSTMITSEQLIDFRIRVAIVAVAHKLSVRAAVVLMKQRPYEVRQKVQSAPLTQEETVPQGTTRRLAVPGETNS